MEEIPAEHSDNFFPVIWTQMGNRHRMQLLTFISYFCNKAPDGHDPLGLDIYNHESAILFITDTNTN